jgi:hypothetical protein
MGDLKERTRAVAVLLLLLALVSQTLSAQETKRWLALAIVTEYRAAPIYVDGIGGSYIRQPGRYYSQDDQLIGLSPGVDIRKNIFRHRIEGAYGIRFKYGHLLYDGPSSAGLGKSINAWTTDHLLSINGRIPVGEKREVRIAVGHGFMNRGSDYTTTQVDSLFNGQTIAFTLNGNFHYGSDFVSLSYSVSGLECGVTAYASAKVTNYDNRSPFWLLGLFLKYDIWRSSRPGTRSGGVDP